MMSHKEASVIKSPLLLWRAYYSAIAILLLIYLISQWFYITYAQFSIDDFWLAYHAYQYKNGLPYRDFLPYKSVLGYYVFLIPLLLFHGVMSPLIYTKAWIVLINAFFLGAAAIWLKKFFSAQAVFCSLVLIIFSPTFMLYSSEIRVDLFAYWACLMSVLCLFDKKYALAGVCLGVGFLISQKASWYVVAMNGGLIGHYLVNERSWKMLKKMARLNAASFLTLLLYVVFWSSFSSYSIVLRSLFYEPYFINSIDFYVNYKQNFWFTIINSYMLLVFLCPLALIRLLCLSPKKRIFIVIYVSIIVLFIVACKQPFLYMPIAAVPALLVLFSAFFSTLHTYRPSSTYTYVYSVSVPIFIVVCYCVLAAILHVNYLLPSFNGRYQKSILHLMAHLLHGEDSYVAGVPLLLNTEQKVPGLIHLVAPSIDYLRHPSEKMHQIMTLSSLYFSPATVPDIINSIKTAPIKLYVDNNRFHFLPKELHRYLHSQFKHFWGSIYLYAPSVAAGQQRVNIKFPGNYKVNATTTITLDNQTLSPHEMIRLVRREYTSNARSSYRLELVPYNVKPYLEPQYKMNHWKDLLEKS